MKPDTITNMTRTLLVTNDFPPRKGGIQTYLEGFARELDPESLIVYCSSPPDGGADEYDAAQRWTTIRHPGTIMLPTPGVRRHMQRIIREHSIEAVWFGASTPLGLMANAARAAGARNVISTTHGHEVGWAKIPAGRSVLRKIFHDADIVTYLTKATLRKLRPLIGSTRIIRLPGGIEPEKFAYSDSWRQRLRERYGIGDEPVIVCISRLVERKGQDTLIGIWPEIVAAHPRAKLVIVGKGPYEDELRQMARESSAHANIVFTGEVPFDELPAHYSLGDIFAMPCRTRAAGMDIEGLGIVYLEAYAAGLPVVAGDSGGAPEAVLDGETGIVASGHHPQAVASAITYLLDNPSHAKQMGKAGLAWVGDEWRWSRLAAALREELAPRELNLSPTGLPQT